MQVERDMKQLINEKTGSKSGTYIHQCCIVKVRGEECCVEGTQQIWQQCWDQERKGRCLLYIRYRAKWETTEGGRSGFIRLGIGHSNLNSKLHILGRHDNGMCRECQERETVERVLMSCMKYNSERVVMVEEFRRRWNKELRDILISRGNDRHPHFEEHRKS